MVFPFLDVRSLKSDPMEQLSPRERSLLEALSKGRTNRELAQEFDITINTVKFHLSNLFEKLGVRNRDPGHRLLLFPPRRAAAISEAGAEDLRQMSVLTESAKNAGCLKLP